MNKEIEQINYIASYLNIAINDNNIIAKDLYEIENKDKFIAFMKENINSEDIRFLGSPLAKLNELKRKYSKKLKEDIISKIQAIESKIAGIVALVPQEEMVKLSFDNFAFKDGGLLFDLDEIKLLEAIGGLEEATKLFHAQELKKRLEVAIRGTVESKALFYQPKETIKPNQAHKLNALVKKALS